MINTNNKIKLDKKLYYLSSPKKWEELISKIMQLSVVTNLSDMLELVEILQWIKDKNFFDKVILDDNLEKKIYNILGKSISSKEKKKELFQIYLSEDEFNTNNFHKLFVKFKIWDSLEDIDFKEYLSSNKRNLKYLMRDKKIIEKFSTVIYDSFLTDSMHTSDNIILIMNSDKATNFPNSFSNSGIFQIMVEKLVSTQSQSDTRSISLYQQILDFKSSIFPLNESIKFQLQTLINDYWEQQHETSNALSSIKVSLKEDLGVYTPIDVKINGTNASVFLSKQWLDAIPREDFIFYILPGIYVDQFNRFLSISSAAVPKKELAEIMIGNSYNENMYRDDIITLMWGRVVTGITTTLEVYLEKKDESIEEVISKYINERINKVHGVEGFSMNNIDPTLPYHTKIKLLSIELESVLKQFQLFVTYKEVNIAYLEYMPPLDINAIKSMKEDKYVIVDYDELDNYQAGTLGKIPSQIKPFDYLPEYLIPGDLINDFEEFKTLEKASGLFAPREAEFLNYCLNNSMHHNALGIRNKYLHGSTMHYSKEKHHNNYVILLKVFLLVIAKFEEEFALFLPN
ncbi:hypothetical protein B9W73_05010 [Lactococcus lactis]|jgi:hypothetical protein|uniref:DUF4209 domain-containing protein n=1 Tax=Lactococcus lactis subsp. lactis NCDO 2118 TaxID=1117941 RepID=A0ABC8A4D4_LACLL|nr:hypothetical protein [Lactococcus lactis]ADA64430.1 Hypothetical protein LLKF_0687 [Lactococcus lactis subsp. lactis KF147]AII12180.1 Hypothetical protein NCDO2118_0686 [Lactococcus lactis subsp. lactis NCDO 2118]OSP87628.1 hypothetical protein B9W73_05010 [Lactococcus lactis]